MKKYWILICFIAIFPANAESLLSNYYSNNLAHVKVIDNAISYINEAYDIEESFANNIVEVNKVPFIENKGSRILALYSQELIFLYKNDDVKPFFWGTSNGKGRGFERIYTLKNIETDSFLSEGNIQYSPNNLSSFTLETPWVEGVLDYGIGQKIKLPKGNVRNIYINNGYVSFDKPHLYTDNSRIKKIRITDELNDISTIVELKDTPNPQIIQFDEGLIRELAIEILEVYEGLKYKDTCINFILVEA